MASSTKSTDVLIINCDETYPLDSVQALVKKSSQATGIKTTVEPKSFSLPKLTEVSEEVKGKQLLCAILVLNAHESRLSINEKNAGIGYAVLYRALREASDGRVLVVIGGDEKSSAADTKVVSNWVRYKVASQFEDEYLNGKRGFVFSWGKSFNPVHEEAFKQYLRAIVRGRHGLDKPFSPTVPLLPEPTDQEKKEKKMATYEVRGKDQDSASRASVNMVPGQSQASPKSDNKESASSTSSTASKKHQTSTRPQVGTHDKSTRSVQDQSWQVLPAKGHLKNPKSQVTETQSRLWNHLAELKKKYPGIRGKLIGVLKYGKLDEKNNYVIDESVQGFEVPKHMKKTFLDENKGIPERDVVIYEDPEDVELAFAYLDQAAPRHQSCQIM